MSLRHDVLGAGINRQEAQQAIDDLVADVHLRLTERNRRFLQFVCTEALAGRSGQIKAYTIAVDVFGRAADFDPVIDPIVRIEAMRMRSALAHYYETAGATHRCRVTLPKGGYVPAFEEWGPSRADAPNAREAAPADDDDAGRPTDRLADDTHHPVLHDAPFRNQNPFQRYIAIAGPIALMVTLVVAGGLYLGSAIMGTPVYAQGLRLQHVDGRDAVTNGVMTAQILTSLRATSRYRLVYGDLQSTSTDELTLKVVLAFDEADRPLIYWILTNAEDGSVIDAQMLLASPQARDGYRDLADRLALSLDVLN